MQYKFAKAIRKYAEDGGKPSKEEVKQRLEQFQRAATGISIALPVGTTAVGALGGGGLGYLLGKAFKKDPKQWSIGGALAGGGVGLGLAAPFSAFGLAGAHATGELTKKMDKPASFRKCGKTSSKNPYPFTAETMFRNIDRAAERLGPRAMDSYDHLSKEDRELVWNTAKDLRNESRFKGIGIPIISSVGGAGIGGIGGYLLGKYTDKKNSGLYGALGALLGAGAGAGISIPMTKEHREDAKFWDIALSNMD